jgi:hypothetical protein
MQMPFNTGLLKSAGPTTNQSAAASQDLLSLIKAMGLASKPSAIAQGFRAGQFIDATPMQKGLGIVGANPNLLRTEDGGKVQKMQQGGDVLGVQGSIANQSPIGDVLGVQGSAMNQLAPVQQQVQEQLGIGLPGMQATGIAGPQMDQISQLLQILMQQQGQQPPSRGRGLMEDGGKVKKGGEVQGPKHPPDQVPILATGGEVVLDPPTVAMLEAFDGSPEMAMQIVQQVIEVSQRSPEMVGKQFGGPIPTAGSSVANPPGGTASFLQGLDPAAPPDPGQLAIQQAQEARRRADLFRQAAFNSPRGAQINQMAEEAEAAAQLAEQAVTQMAVAATPRKTELEQTTIQKGIVENGQAATFEEGLSLAHREVQQSREPERAAQLAEIAGGSQQVQDALNGMDVLEQSGSDIGSIIVGFQTLMAMGIPDETLEALFPKSMQMLESQVRKNK